MISLKYQKKKYIVKRDSGLLGSKDMDSLMIAERGLEDGATDSFIPAQERQVSFACDDSHGMYCKLLTTFCMPFYNV